MQSDLYPESTIYRLGHTVERYKHRIRALLVGGSALVVLLVAVMYVTAERHAVIEHHAPLFVRHGDAGVDFSRPSAAILCSELRKGRTHDGQAIAALVESADHALAHNETVCVCAPMFGNRYRHVAFRSAKAGIVHAFNPRQQTFETGRSRMRENMRLLFPKRLDNVVNVRFDAVKIEHENEHCIKSNTIVRDRTAYCVQMCLDLLNGMTVYDRAAKEKT